MPEFRCHDINRLSTGDVFKRLEATDSGLTTDEAARRFLEFGPNILAETDRYSAPRGLSRHFTHFLALFLGLNSALLAMGEFFLYLFANGWTWSVHLDWNSPFLKSATTVTLAGIVSAQVADVFACRSARLPIFSLDWFTNPLILGGIAVELTLLVIITYTPVGNNVFGTNLLPLWIFGPLTVGAFVCLLAEEARKLIASRIFTNTSIAGDFKRRSS